MLNKLFFTLIILNIILLSVYLSENKADYSCQNCNVIMITMTNLRYDHMSGNGYFRPTTPNLDKLIKEGLNFTNAFSHASWTLPESISIYTSLYPFQHGVMNRFDGSKLSKDTPTLVDVFNKNGYKTAMFTGGFDYNPVFGLTNRFSTYEECSKPEGKALPSFLRGGPNLYGELTCTIPKAISWLKKYKEEKFFIHVQGYDVHCPFSQKGGKTFDQNYNGTIDFSYCLWTFDKKEPVINGKEEFYPVYSASTGVDKEILLSKKDVSHLIALYDEGIVSADDQIGRFLKEIEALGLSKNTIIIFTAEHGDMFGKYGRFMRGGPLKGTFYDDVLHIPLIIKHPKFSPRYIDGLASHIDLAPTLLNFLGLNGFAFEGKNLMPLIREGKEVNSAVFAGSLFNPPSNNVYVEKKSTISSIRTKDWKLIKEITYDSNKLSSQTVELFDLLGDKEELHNLANDKKDMVNTLESFLNKWEAKVKKN